MNSHVLERTLNGQFCDDDMAIYMEHIRNVVESLFRVDKLGDLEGCCH